MKFVLNRDKVLRSVYGHTIEFIKGEPTHVPPMVWPEAQAIGAVPEDELPEEKKPETKEPIDPVARKKVIFDAFEQVVLGAKREDFGANGVPHIKALDRLMGFTLSVKDRDALWLEFQRKGKDD